MPKMSENDLEKIISRDAPGFELARPADATDERPLTGDPEDTAPDIDALKRKYLRNPDVDVEGGNPGPEYEAESADAADASEADDDEIVALRSKDPADAFDHVARPKTVVISGEDQRIIGSQG